MDDSLAVPAGLVVARSIADVRRQVAAARGKGHAIGFVPTMGALHPGHLSLIDAARERCDCIVVSIFVNPSQFGPNEDFERYPRTLEADLAACRQSGAEVVFLPAAGEIYPDGFSTTVDVAGLSEILEGAIRPAHFRGVATVVLKLLNIVSPDVAFFGQKDYQQQLIIRRMVADLDLPVEIDVRPTVREPDGLAMSSRNRYLDREQRRAATAISAALFEARDRLEAVECDLDAVRRDMRRAIESAGLTTDYTVIADRRTLRDLSKPQPEMVLLVAARLGDIRLIDNVEVQVGEDRRPRFEEGLSHR